MCRSDELLATTGPSVAPIRVRFSLEVVVARQESKCSDKSFYPYIDYQSRSFSIGALKAFPLSRIISMEEIGLIERIQELTDLELALLLSLVAGEHCIIQTEEEALDPLEEELELV